MKDEVFSKPRTAIKPFAFDETVADVFENMIKRSVPGYESLLDFIGVLTENYARANTRCYDLGCSLGASTLQIRRHLPHGSCQVIAVDNSEAMISRCRRIIERDRSEARVDVLLEDVRQVDIINASLVTLNFTLQFIPQPERLPLLERIYAGLNPGGALVLSEKIRFEDDDTQQLMTELHHQFKKHMGYSDLEVAQKRASLENVLIPDTLKEHRERLKKAGFLKIYPFFQSFNFIALLAIKEENHV